MLASVSESNLHVSRCLEHTGLRWESVALTSVHRRKRVLFSNLELFKNQWVKFGQIYAGESLILCLYIHTCLTKGFLKCQEKKNHTLDLYKKKKIIKKNTHKVIKCQCKKTSLNLFLCSARFQKTVRHLLPVYFYLAGSLNMLHYVPTLLIRMSLPSVFILLNLSLSPACFGR